MCQLWPGLNSQESLLFYFSFEVSTLLFIHFDLSIVPQIYYICSQPCFSSRAVSLPYAAILSLVGLANCYSPFKNGIKCYLSCLAFPDIYHRLSFFPVLSLYLLPPYLHPQSSPCDSLGSLWQQQGAGRVAKKEGSSQCSR